MGVEHEGGCAIITTVGDREPGSIVERPGSNESFIGSTLVKRSVVALLVVGALLGGACEPAAAHRMPGMVRCTHRRTSLASATGGLTMVVTAGFDGYCRTHSDGGGWCAVHVALSNEGADVAGELRVASGTDGGAVPNVYARQVVLPVHSRKAYFFYLPSAESTQRSRLDVQLLAGDTVLAAGQTVVTWLQDGDRLYGVASSSPSALNFLGDVAPAGGRAAVAHVDLETLPPDPLGWEGLDVLILNDVDTTVLSGDQRQALEVWVAHGGHLIVGGGGGVARTVAGVAGLLPVAVGGPRSTDVLIRDDLRALGEWLNAPIAPGPYAVAGVALQGGEVLIEQGDESGTLTLLARRTCGAGAVSFMAFDAGLNPFTRWHDNVRLWESVIDVGKVGVPRFTVQDWYRARDAVNAVPGLKLPPMLQMLAFMLVYTLLIGPANYVVLRKLDRRELAWLTIPALIVGFTVCAYVTGFQVRGTAAIVHRLAVVHVPEGTSIGRVSQVVGLFSPRRTTYDVRVAGRGARQMPGGDYGTGTGRPLHVVEEAEGLTITGVRVDVGGIQPFVTEGYVKVSGVEADLQLATSASGHPRVEGTIRNGDVPLAGAVLMVGDVEQRLGDLEPGEEVSVYLPLEGSRGAGATGGGIVGGATIGMVPTPLPAAPYYGAGTSEPDMVQRVLGPGDYWGDPALYRRYIWLQAVFPYGAPYAGGGAWATGPGPGVHLIGWVEEEIPLPVEVVRRPFSVVGTALYVYDVPVAGLEAGTMVIVPPALIGRHMVERTDGIHPTSSSAWFEGGSIHLEPGAEAVFRFVVWPGVAVRRVDELVLDLWGSSYGNTAHPPAVWLWNRESSDWESLDVGWGRHSIPYPESYVLPSGVLLLRLQAETEWVAIVDSLTITIEGQR